jgi:hypothetical protein
MRVRRFSRRTGSEGVAPVPKLEERGVKRVLLLVVLNLGLFAPAALAGAPLPGATAAPAKISAQRIAHHVELLASDAFEGRSPGTKGEDKTVAYIAERFRRAGLRPGFRGSWFQDVGLIRVEPSPSTTLTLSEDSGASAVLRQGKDVMLVNGRWEPDAAIDRSEVVFVGYGISAPSLGRDDYKGLNVAGRTVLMLAWAPETQAFAGAARIRYGLPTMKTAEAARRGAAAVLIVVPDDGWEQSLTAVRTRMLNPAGASPPGAPPIDGRIKRSVMQGLLASGETSLERLEQQAGQPGFRPAFLKLRATARLRSKVQRFNSRNVVGLLPGTERPAEHVLFVAHWDSFGLCATGAAEDRICNGALDNASGVGEMIELARLFASRGRLPRSVLFLAATGEEHGLLGSNHYVGDPALPLAGAVGGATLDMTAGRRRGTDLVLFGKGLSELDAYFERAASLQGRKLVAPRPDDAGYFERSDNMAFVRKGVPVLTPSGLWSEGAGRELLDRYEAESYHKPSDEFGAIASFEGAAEDGELLYHFGRELASTDDWPAWRKDSPYGALRPSRTTPKSGE